MRVSESDLSGAAWRTFDQHPWQIGSAVLRKVPLKKPSGRNIRALCPDRRPSLGEARFVAPRCVDGQERPAGS